MSSCCTSHQVVPVDNLAALTVDKQGIFVFSPETITPLTLKKHTRRRFLQIAVTGTGLSMVFLWDKMMGTQLLTTLHQKIVLPLTRHLVSFYGDYIVINQKQHIEVFSSHCTHLGCIINKVENGRLICPCHGSEFNLEGDAVKGPAYKPLKVFPFKESSDGQQITIQPAET